jgi:hypothetical protein
MLLLFSKKLKKKRQWSPATPMSERCKIKQKEGKLKTKLGKLV